MGNEYFFRVFSENMCGLSEAPGTSKKSAYIQKAGSTLQTPQLVTMERCEFDEARSSFTHPLVSALSSHGTMAHPAAVRLRGTPKPKVFWYKNKMDLSEEARYRMFSKQGVLTMELRKPSPFDGGVYTCKAVNQFGEAETECRLEVRVPQ
ncbi:hypothetical protein FKM82_003365 [Ascaphus truei]